jgi:hypothetical protein
MSAHTARLLIAALALLAASAAWADDALPSAPPLPDCRTEPLGPPMRFDAEYRPGLDDPAALKALAILGVTLAYQCPGVAGGGGVVPEGWRAALVVACEGGGCALPPAVLALDFSGKAFTGTIRDEAAVRDVRLTRLRSGRLSLAVRTRSIPGGSPITARYLLVPADAVAPSAGPGAAPPLRKRDA